MKGRQERLVIDLAPARSPDEMLSILARALSIRNWDDRDRAEMARAYHDDWYVFYECIELREDMPRRLRLSGWSIVEARMPRDSGRLRECFNEMAVYYPESVPIVEYA